MPEKKPIPPARPLRHGETWTWTDYEQLLQGVFNGLAIQEIGAELGRTQGAVRAGLARLVPGEAKMQRTDQRVEWLRVRLQENPAFDWQSVVNSHLNDPFRLWSDAEEQLLRDGWDRRSDLPDLVESLQVSEPAIAHRLIERGLAFDIGEVVDRLGATAGGSVEARARLLRAELAEAAYVLIIERPGRPRSSLHYSEDEAKTSLHRIVGDPSITEARRRVMRRTLNGRDAGRSWTGPSPRE